MATPRRATGVAATFDLKAYQHVKGYVRVSTDEQAEEGTSIQAQIKQIKHFAAAFGVDLVDDDLYVDDGWSGKDLHRPAMDRLRTDARAGLADCVLVAKLDRFSRNLRDTVNLCLGEWQDDAPDGRRVALKSVSEPFDTHSDFGRMVFGLLAMFAEFERRRIADRTWSGKAARAEAGRNAGHRAPYGYALAPAPDGRGSFFRPVPEEAAMVEYICRLYLQGYGDQQIAVRLNEEGRRFRGGRLWQSQQISRIVTNPIIAGVYAYGRTAAEPHGGSRRLPEAEWIRCAGPGAPEPIISPDTFARIRRLRAGRWTGGRTSSGSSLLSGLLRCGRCGSACALKLSGPGGRYRYYRCLQRKQSGPAACDQPQIRADEVEQQVLAAVQGVLLASGPALADIVGHRLRVRSEGLQRRAQELGVELQGVAELRARYYGWLETGQMRPEAVQARLDELAAREMALSGTIRQVSAEQESPELPRSFADGWDRLAPYERKRLLAALFSHIEVDGLDLVMTWAHNAHTVQFSGPE